MRPLVPDRASQLQPVLDDKLRELQETVSLLQNQGLDAALAVVRTARGQRATDQIRAICSAVNTTAYATLQRHGEQARGQFGRSVLFSITGALLLVFLLAGANVLVGRTMAQRERLIDELRASNEAAHQAERRFRGAFEQAAVGIAHVTLDGRFILVNRRLAELGGYTPEELSALPWHAVVTPLRIRTRRRFCPGAAPRHCRFTPATSVCCGRTGLVSGSASLFRRS